MSTQEKPCLPIFFTWSDEYGCQLWDKAGMQKYAKAAEVATIERCAKICDEWQRTYVLERCCDLAQHNALKSVAAAIRALLPKEEG